MWFHGGGCCCHRSVVAQKLAVSLTTGALTTKTSPSSTRRASGRHLETRRLIGRGMYPSIAPRCRVSSSAASPGQPAPMPKLQAPVGMRVQVQVQVQVQVHRSPSASTPLQQVHNVHTRAAHLGAYGRRPNPPTLHRPRSSDQRGLRRFSTSSLQTKRSSAYRSTVCVHCTQYRKKAVVTTRRGKLKVSGRRDGQRRQGQV